mgnify:CR=1 FL=1
MIEVPMEYFTTSANPIPIDERIAELAKLGLPIRLVDVVDFKSEDEIRQVLRSKGINN